MNLEAPAPRRYRVTLPLGHPGELLITIAVILGLFAVWQFVLDGIQGEGPL